MIHVTKKARKWLANRKRRKNKKLSERWFFLNTNCENEHPAHAVARKSSSIETIIRALRMCDSTESAWVGHLFKEVKG